MSILKALRRFGADRRGGIAIMLAVAAPVMVATAGVAIDFSRAASAKTDLANSLDSIGQQVTTQVNSCIAAMPVNHTGSACLNNQAFVAGVTSEAQALLTAMYRQRGQSVAPHITGTPYYDRASGIYRVSGSVATPCIFMKQLTSVCDITVNAQTAVRGNSQALELLATGPLNLEAWALTSGDQLPLQYNATGGFLPYRWSMGPNPIPGLALDGTTGLLSEQAGGAGDVLPCDSLACDPQAMGRVQVAVTDSGDPARAGAGAQTAATGTDMVLVHPLTLVFQQNGAGTGALITVAADHLSKTLQLVRGGGKGGYIYDLENPPSGVAVDHATGLVTITTAALPVNLASLVLKGIVTDIRGKTATARESLILVTGPTVLEVWANTTGDQLPAQYTITGGTPPYSWTMATSPVPGLVLDPASGLLAGPAGDVTPCPTAACDPQAMGLVDILVNDSSGQAALTTVDLTLVHPLSLSFAAAGVPVSSGADDATKTWTVQRLGGKAGYVYQQQGLQPGWTFDTATGTVTGTLPKPPYDIRGTLLATVTDIRGKTATAHADYHFSKSSSCKNNALTYSLQDRALTAAAWFGDAMAYGLYCPTGPGECVDETVMVRIAWIAQDPYNPNNNLLPQLVCINHAIPCSSIIQFAGDTPGKFVYQCTQEWFPIFVPEHYLFSSNYYLLSDGTLAIPVQPLLREDNFTWSISQVYNLRCDWPFACMR